MQLKSCCKFLEKTMSLQEATDHKYHAIAALSGHNICGLDLRLGKSRCTGFYICSLSLYCRANAR